MRRLFNRLTDSETPLGNLVLCALLGLVLLSWLGCAADNTGLNPAAMRARMAVDADGGALPDAMPPVDSAPATVLDAVSLIVDMQPPLPSDVLPPPDVAPPLAACTFNVGTSPGRCGDDGACRLDDGTVCVECIDADTLKPPTSGLPCTFATRMQPHYRTPECRRPFVCARSCPNHEGPSCQ